MFLRILITSVAIVASANLFAAENYVIQAKNFSQSRFSYQQSFAPIRTLSLEEHEAQSLRSKGYLVEKDISFHILEDTKEPDSDRAAIWPAEVMNLSAAHELENSKGEGQTVCLVDTGIDKNHSMFFCSDIETYNSIDLSTNANDGQGHGTFNASLIVGAYHPSAPAPKAKLLVVKSLDDSGAGTLADVVRGIEYCASRSAVINLSLGSDVDSEILHQAIKAAAASGVIIVASASNSGRSNDVGFPAGYDEVITVVGVDEKLQIPASTSHGFAIDFAAPGYGVWGALPGEKFGVLNGNSMATAFVSGVVAVAKSRGSMGLLARDIGFPLNYQGQGLINVFATAMNIED